MTTTQDTSAKRIKTPEEVVGGMRRMIKAVEIRATTEDPWMAKEMLDMAKELEEATVRVVASLRARGYRWEDIAFQFEISATTAVKRWAKRVDEINGK